MEELRHKWKVEVPQEMELNMDSQKKPSAIVLQPGLAVESHDLLMKHVQEWRQEVRFEEYPIIKLN